MSRISDIIHSASYDNSLALVFYGYCNYLLKFTTQQNNFEYPLYQAFQFVFIIENIIIANYISFFLLSLFLVISFLTWVTTDSCKCVSMASGL